MRTACSRLQRNGYAPLLTLLTLVLLTVMWGTTALAQQTISPFAGEYVGTYAAIYRDHDDPPGRYSRSFRLVVDKQGTVTGTALPVSFKISSEGYASFDGEFPTLGRFSYDFKFFFRNGIRQVIGSAKVISQRKEGGLQGTITWSGQDKNSTVVPTPTPTPKNGIPFYPYAGSYEGTFEASWTHDGVPVQLQSGLTAEVDSTGKATIDAGILKFSLPLSKSGQATLSAAYTKTGSGSFNIKFASQPDGRPIFSGGAKATFVGDEYPGEVVNATLSFSGRSMPTPSLGVDLNRDGFIDNQDKTSEIQPYRFWLNTDHDAYDKDEKDEKDLEPSRANLDCNDSVISCERDLEDFIRFRVDAPSDFKPDGSWKCVVSFANTTGAPAIRIWPAVSPNSDYLTDPQTAKKQIDVTSNWPLSTGVREIPLSYFTSKGLDKYQATFLFEAITKGKGALVVRFYKDGKERTSINPVWLDLRPIQDFYDYYRLPSVNFNGPPPRFLLITANPDVTRIQNTDYILFVHGWRQKEWTKQAFAETAFKRLWHRGYKGRFGLFSWPTGYTDLIGGVPAKPGNYDWSERVAWNSATTLRTVLTSINAGAPGKVRVLAHSMGNVVTSEALLQEAESGLPQRIVHTYVASQAATPAQSYDAAVKDNPPSSRKPYTGPNVYVQYPPTKLPYFQGRRGKDELKAAAGALFNFYNPFDHALNGWRANQALRPDVTYSYGYNLAIPPQLGFNRNLTRLTFPGDKYEIFAYAAPAFSLALGAQSVGGVFSSNVNLSAAPFSYTNAPSDHSAQFNSNLMLRHSYWDTLMSYFKISFTTPK